MSVCTPATSKSDVSRFWTQAICLSQVSVSESERNISVSEAKSTHEMESKTETKILLEKEKDDKLSYLKKASGIIAMLLTVILFCTSAICVQLLERRIPDLELNTFRCGIPLIFYVIGLVVIRRWPMIDRSQIGTALLFSMFTTGSGLFTFVAVTFLPAAAVLCISSTSTIVAGLFLFALCRTERVTPKKVLFAGLCVCGVIFVIQPWVQLETYGITEKENPSDNVPHAVNKTTLTTIKSSHETTETTGETFETSSCLCEENRNRTKRPQSNPGNVTGILSQIVGYTASVSSRTFLTPEVLVAKRNSYINEHTLETLFWGWTAGTTASLILMFTIETPVLPRNWFDVCMVTIHSATCAAIWPLVIYGSSTVHGNTVTIIASTAVVFMLISQYTVLSSILPGHRNWMEVVRVFLVLLGSSLSSVLEILADTKLISCWKVK